MTGEPLYLGHAIVYQRADALYLCAEDRTDWRSAGFLVHTERIARLATDVSADVLGRAVADALKAGRAGVLPPPRGEIARVLAPLLRAARVRSWRAFVHGAIACFVERQSGQILLSPTTGGTKDFGNGFVMRPDVEVCLPADGAPAEWGRAVRAALTHCSIAIPKPSSSQG